MNLRPQPAPTPSKYFVTAAFVRPPSTVLMGRIQVRIVVISIVTQGREVPLPDPALGPAVEPLVDAFPLSVPFRQLPPGTPGALAIQHRLNEHPIIRCRPANMPDAPRQHVRNPRPLVIP